MSPLLCRRTPRQAMPMRCGIGMGISLSVLLVDFILLSCILWSRFNIPGTQIYPWPPSRKHLGYFGTGIIRKMETWWASLIMYFSLLSLFQENLMTWVSNCSRDRLLGSTAYERGQTILTARVAPPAIYPANWGAYGRRQGKFKENPKK